MMLFATKASVEVLDLSEARRLSGIEEAGDRQSAGRGGRHELKTWIDAVDCTVGMVVFCSGRESEEEQISFLFFS